MNFSYVCRLLELKVKHFGSRFVRPFPCDSHRFLCYVCGRLRNMARGRFPRVHPRLYGIYTNKGFYIWVSSSNPHKKMHLLASGSRNKQKQTEIIFFSPKVANRAKEFATLEELPQSDRQFWRELDERFQNLIQTNRGLFR